MTVGSAPAGDGDAEGDGDGDEVTVRDECAATWAADKTSLAYLSTGTGTPRPARRRCRRAGKSPRLSAAG
ncbi:hypothetical protein GCM10010220_27030 [Streptomyces parvulus]|nr:hypothetical protein GCM10010220_27030 [Streptomyces parvulus]